MSGEESLHQNQETSQILHFKSNSNGQRLDQFLASRCQDLSRSRIQKLIAEGHVKVDGLEIKASFKLKQGQEVNVNVVDTPPNPMPAQPIPLNITYEDKSLLVIDKPAGLTVHPGPGHRDHTLANAVLAHYPKLKEIGGPLRVGIVHRLDKDTSGLLVVAKNEKTHVNLATQFELRQVTKIYLALVLGKVSPPEAIIEAPIGRDPRDRKRMTVIKTGKEAITHYRILRQYKSHTLLEIRPKTGRTHQIRVHLASVGHALEGDMVYGKKNPPLDRQFLHAHMLIFKHPLTKKELEFKSELSSDLHRFLDTLN